MRIALLVLLLVAGLVTSVMLATAPEPPAESVRPGSSNDAADAIGASAGQLHAPADPSVSDIPQRQSADEPVSTAVDASALRVVVEDFRGAPAAGFGARLWRTDVDGRERVRTVTTDEAGVASIAAVLDAQARWTVDVDLLCADELEVAIDPIALPDEVRIRLPALGSLEVEFLGVDGLPYAGLAAVVVAIVPADKGREYQQVYRRRRPSERAALMSGKAQFEQVPVTQELELLVHAEGFEEPTIAYRSGPGGAGQLARARIAFSEDHVTTGFRVVTPSGEPVAEAELVASMSWEVPGAPDGRRSSRSQTLLSGDVGRVVFELPASAGEVGSGNLSIHQERGRDVVASGERRLPDGLGLGWTELGEIVLAEPVAIVKGVVVDDEGEPVRRAYVTIARSGQPVLRSELYSRTDRDGRFAIYGALDAGKFEARAMKGGYFPSEAEPLPVSGDLRFVVRRAGRVVGSLRTQPNAYAFSLTLVPSAVERRELLQTGLDQEGEFTFSGCLPGEYTFRVMVDGLTAPILEVGGIEVRPGRTTRDPRLKDIDLDEHGYRFRLTFSAPAAEFPFSGHVRHGPAGAETLGARAWIHSSELVLWSPFPSIDVDVRVTGYRLEELRGLTGNREVFLQPGLSVRLVLNGGGVRLQSGKQLLAELHRETTPWVSMPAARPAFDESGECVLRVAEPGRFRVAWMIAESLEGMSFPVPLETADETFVEVAGSDGEQVLRVELPTPALEPYLER